ncbi:MAG: hypothetical protein LBQ48_07215 [Oscillospiraceae bacterium]|jgi:hypothetical protein|nr:hypothetical protein [Oscillospiraceae bacterium]
MKKFKLGYFLLAAALVCGGLPACKPETGTNTSQGFIGTESLPVGEGVESSGGDFNNASSGPTPGEDGAASGGGTSSNPSNSSKAETVSQAQSEEAGDSVDEELDEELDEESDEELDEESSDSEPVPVPVDNSASLLNKQDTLQYYYEGAGYAYGITQDGSEVLSFLDANGQLKDAARGAGYWSVGNVVEGMRFREFQRTVVNGDRGVIVRYDGVCKSGVTAEIETRYVFTPAGVSVTSDLIVSGSTSLSSSGSRLKRSFIYDYDEDGNQILIPVERTLNYEWVYPENDDFPYRKVESYVTVNKFDSGHYLYTFLRSSDIPENYSNLYTAYPAVDIPLFFGDALASSESPFKTTVKYDLAFEQVYEGRNSRYMALFGGQGSDYAAGIAPVSEAEPNSTVFIGDEAELNLNVTNLTKEALQYSVRYELYDYYGHMLDSNIFINSSLPVDFSANRRVKIKADNNYGIFFLNFVVATGRYVYREYYPLLLLPDTEYRYTSTSPFGVNQIQNTGGWAMDFLNLASKIGVANLRTAALFAGTTDADKALFEECKRLGFYLIGSSYGDAAVDYYKDYITDIVYGNELNLQVINGNQTLEQAFSTYYGSTFKTGLTMKQKYGINHICAGISAGQTAWINKLGEHWDEFDIIDLHTYGLPYSPDLKVSSSQTWHVEQSLQRTRAAVDQIGSKRIYIHETGYCSAPGGRQGTDLRTMAEYNTRCFILALAYGVERVMTYGFTDYSNSGIGAAYSDTEYNFGQFYWVDYFDRIMPKPSAASFAGMTRTLESVRTVEINDRYTQGKVRAFTADTAAHGNVVVAWSNCAPLPTDTMTMMTRPYVCLPWNSQWKSSEKVEFEAFGSEVTVVDTMGNAKKYPVQNGKASVELNGAPVFIIGVNP